jgi:hypothetical protein
VTYILEQNSNQPKQKRQKDCFIGADTQCYLMDQSINLEMKSYFLPVLITKCIALKFPSIKQIY